MLKESFAITFLQWLAVKYHTTFSANHVLMPNSGWFARSSVLAGAHQIEPPSAFISWVNPFPSRFINRTKFFCYALESHECACCLLFVVSQCYCLFSFFIGSFLYQRAKPPQGTVLFLSLLGKGLTSRACIEDEGSILWLLLLSISEGCEGVDLLRRVLFWLCFIVWIFKFLTKLWCSIVKQVKEEDLVYQRSW